MTWQAILESASIDSTCECTIVYTDGQTKFRKGYTSNQLDNATLEAVARAEVSRLGAVAASVGKLSYQPGAQINLKVAAPADPTPEQLAQAQFLADLHAYQQLQRAAALGLIASDDARIAPLLKALQGEWLDSYVGLV